MGSSRSSWALKASVASALLTAALSSCAGGERPFLIVQLCLGNDRSVDQFKTELQAIAHQEHMRFVDRSRVSERELDTLRVLNLPTGKLVNVGVLGDRGPSLAAGNLGLSSYDVAVGFSRGQNNQAAQAFSERVVARLKQHWPVKVIPTGSGALPDPRCVSEPEPAI